MDSKEVLNNYDSARNYYREGAFDQCRRCLQIIEDNTAPRAEHELRLYCAYSLCLFRMGECAEALAKAEQGLSQYPDCRELYYIKGQIFYEMQLLGNSCEYFKKFIAVKTSFINPKADTAGNCPAYIYLIVIAVRLEKYDEAIYYLQLYMREKPNISELKKLCRPLLKFDIDKKAFTEVVLSSNIASATDLAEMLIQSGDYAACLDVIKGFDKEMEYWPAWIECQLHLGRYKLVRQAIGDQAVRKNIDPKSVVYYCLAGWLENPRRSQKEFLLNQDEIFAEIKACSWIDQLISGSHQTGSDTIDNRVDDSIKSIALLTYILGDLCLALDIIRNYFTCDNRAAYSYLGREAFKEGFYSETRILLERSQCRPDEEAEDYYELGMAYAEAGCYEYALEQFLQIVALRPENQVYPCLVYEVLAMQILKNLVENPGLFTDNVTLINELLRICTLKCKSKNLRHIIAGRQYPGAGKSDFHDIWPLTDAINEEVIWSINV